ncbi:hypothetical protein CR513_04501, partial [Mucuna pruriens]
MTLIITCGKGKMKDLLLMKKMHLPIFVYQKLESMSDEEWDFKHQQVCGFIWLFVDGNVYNHIASEIHVMTLWEKIESLYVSTLKFKEDISLLDYLNEFKGILDQISGMGIMFENEILGLLLLNSLPESWETFKVSIINLALNGIVTLQILRIVYKNVERHYCHKIGHIQKYCFLWKKENKGKKGKLKEKDHDDDDNDHVTTATGDNLIILQDFESVNLISDESIDFGVLKIGNDGMTKVIGVGDICLQTNMGVQLWLRGVKHARDVHFNLICVHMLDDGGYDNHFGNLVVNRGEKISKLYWTKVLVAKDSMNAMDIEAPLRHLRHSHINEKWLNCLAKKDILPRLKNAKLEKCSHCMAGKQTRVSFKKHPPSRKSELLELVHTDVYGPLKKALGLYFEVKGPSVREVLTIPGFG